MMQILAFLLSLSLLIFLHELGHFFFARLFKTRVEKFYLFFNPSFSILRAKRVNGSLKFSWFSKKAPEEWSEDADSTEWGLGWIPLGGYCAIAGMIDETKKADDLPSEPQPWEYRSKKAWQRLLIISGGVIMNFILAVCIFSMIVFSWGDTYLPLKDVKQGFAFSEKAKEGGFRDGDILISANGKELEMRDGILLNNLFMDFLNARSVLVEREGNLVEINPPREMGMNVISSKKFPFSAKSFPATIGSVAENSEAERIGLIQGDSITKINETSIASFEEIYPIAQENKNKTISIEYYHDGQMYANTIHLDSTGIIGIQGSDYSKTVTDEYGFFSSFPMGAKFGVQTLKAYVAQLRFVFTKEGATQIGGFITIGKIFPKKWNWQTFWNMTAFLSIILAFMNILPIPGLDGGHVMFTLYEMVSGRKPSDKFLERTQMAGMIILFALLIFANGNDVIRLFQK